MGYLRDRSLALSFFNIYLSDLFLFTKESEIINYADDNSPYACRESIGLVMKKLEDDSKILLEWVSQNALKANPDKFHLLLRLHDEHSCVTVDQYKICNSKHLYEH